MNGFAGLQVPQEVEKLHVRFFMLSVRTELT